MVDSMLVGKGEVPDCCVGPEKEWGIAEHKGRCVLRGDVAKRLRLEKISQSTDPGDPSHYRICFSPAVQTCTLKYAWADACCFELHELAVDFKAAYTPGDAGAQPQDLHRTAAHLFGKRYLAGRPPRDPLLLARTLQPVRRRRRGLPVVPRHLDLPHRHERRRTAQVPT
jgi:hypothetical protein